MYELVKLITDTLNETGRLLTEYGYPDLGSFVLEALKEGEKAGAAHGKGPDVDVILERIVKAFPGFQDMAIVDGQRKYFRTTMNKLHDVLLANEAVVNNPVFIQHNHWILKVVVGRRTPRFRQLGWNIMQHC